MTTPLARKLGIGPATRVLLVHAPAGFEIPGLPPGVTVHRRRGVGRYDVALLFCDALTALESGFGPLIPYVETAGALWACWPKKASGVATDLSDDRVREHGLAAGLVDVKVAAVDDVWSGLKFVRRRAHR